MVHLGAGEERSVYVPAGVAHGFCVTSELGTLTYLLSSPFNSAVELEINPFDEELNVPWTIHGDADHGVPRTPARLRFANVVTRSNFLSFFDLSSGGRTTRGIASVERVSTARYDSSPSRIAGPDRLDDRGTGD